MGINVEKQPEIFLLNKPGAKLQIKAYKRRFWIMFLFMYYAAINSIQWIEYSSITYLVVKYYNVSTLAVDWTSTVYMAVYPILVIPASYIIDKKGVRLAALMGCSGTFIGTSLKVFSIRNDLFWVVLLGNTIIAASSLVILCLPPKIATIWFKPNEVSTACSLGVFGSQMGCAIGYILPSLVVQDHPDVENIGKQLKILSWLLAISMVPVTGAVFAYFPDEPPLPPNNVQAILRQDKPEFDNKKFFSSMKKLFFNKGFVIHLVAYGINIAVFSAVGTLLSQLILQYFQDAGSEVGWMGFAMVVAGMIGMLVFGYLLDKTHKYNIFTNAYMMVGFEFGMELTFPAEESTTTGILLASSQILGAIFTVTLGYINLHLGAFWTLSTQVVALFIGTLATASTPNSLLRQEAFKQNNPDINIRKASYHGSRPIFIE